MKSTLWTFGDSQTYGHGCRPDGPLLEYYYEYKKNDDDDIWPNLLSKKLDTKVQNMGICGASNDTILDCMIDNYDNINSGDIVVLNKTFYERFDVLDKTDNKLRAIVGEIRNTKDLKPHVSEKKWGRSTEEIETLIDFSYYFAADIQFKERQDKRFDFVKKMFIRDKKISCFFEWTSKHIYKPVKKIFGDTNGKIVDYHYCFDDHKIVTDVLYDLIIRQIKGSAKNLI